MKNILFTFLFLFLLGCSIDRSAPTSNYDIPTKNHDLSYIPFNPQLDKPDYVVCDSTKIISGRNKLKYVDGAKKLQNDILSNYSYKPEYAPFNGYVVIRFLVNCEGKSGRYRAQSLNLDFSPANAPSNLLTHSIELIKSLDKWVKSAEPGEHTEYSKFINLKIENGNIQHVLL